MSLPLFKNSICQDVRRSTTCKHITLHCDSDRYKQRPHISLGWIKHVLSRVPVSV